MRLLLGVCFSWINLLFVSFFSLELFWWGGYVTSARPPPHQLSFFKSSEVILVSTPRGEDDEGRTLPEVLLTNVSQQEEKTVSSLFRSILILFLSRFTSGFCLFFFRLWVYWTFADAQGSDHAETSGLMFVVWKRHRSSSFLPLFFLNSVNLFVLLWSAPLFFFWMVKLTTICLFSKL